jgi:hypothetical protein
MNWRHTVADLELAVTCGGRQHRLVWSASTVSCPDHPDLAAERALIALGGPEPPCLDFLRLWHDAVADGGFLAEWIDESHFGPARLSWLGTALERLRLEGYHEFLRRLPSGRAERMGQFLHRFPRPWLDRAACEVSEAVADGGGVVCGDAPGLLVAAAAQRLRRAFVASIGGQLVSWGAAALVPLRVSIDGGRAPTVSGTARGPGRAVALSVGPQWLHQVWGAGAAVVDGQLVLAIDSGVQGDRALIVQWEPGSSISSGQQPRATLAHRNLVRHGESWHFPGVPQSNFNSGC